MPIRRTVPWLVSTVSPSTTAENVTEICVSSLMTGSLAFGTADCDGAGEMRSEPAAADGGRAEGLNPSAPACSPAGESGVQAPAPNANNATTIAKHGLRALLIFSTPR